MDEESEGLVPAKTTVYCMDGSHHDMPPSVKVVGDVRKELEALTGSRAPNLCLSHVDCEGIYFWMIHST